MQRIAPDITGTALAPLQSNGGGSLIILLLWLAIALVLIAGMWKAFAKAGVPGWLSLIPIVNTYFMLKIADRPGWWLLLLLVPLVNIVIVFVMMMDISENFGKGIGFAIGLFLFTPIFWALLGFGDAKYVGEPSPGV